MIRVRVTHRAGTPWDWDTIGLVLIETEVGPLCPKSH